MLLQLPRADPVRPTQLIIAEDCFRLSTAPANQVAEALAKSVEKLFGGECIGCGLAFLRSSFVSIVESTNGIDLRQLCQFKEMMVKMFPSLFDYISLFHPCLFIFRLPQRKIESLGSLS